MSGGRVPAVGLLITDASCDGFVSGNLATFSTCRARCLPTLITCCQCLSPSPPPLTHNITVLSKSSAWFKSAARNVLATRTCGGVVRISLPVSVVKRGNSGRRAPKQKRTRTQALRAIPHIDSAGVLSRGSAPSFPPASSVSEKPVGMTSTAAARGRTPPRCERVIHVFEHFFHPHISPNLIGSTS